MNDYKITLCFVTGRKMVGGLCVSDLAYALDPVLCNGEPAAAGDRWAGRCTRELFKECGDLLYDQYAILEAASNGNVATDREQRQEDSIFVGFVQEVV